MSEFRTRIRSVRFKDGRAPLRMFYSEQTKVRDALLKSVERVFAGHPNPAAMALVVWDANGRSTAKMTVSYLSSIPTALVPDFVRNRLLAERIERWTLERLEEQGR